MKRAFIFTMLIFLLIIPLISAINVEVEKISSNEVMVSGVKEAVTFDLNLTNLGGVDNFKFYNLLGFNMFPVGTIPVNARETKRIELKISPIGEFKHSGAYTLEYIIRGNDDSEVRKKLTFDIAELKDVFEIGSGGFDPESSSVEIYIKNKVRLDFSKVNAKFSSAFFEFEETFPISGYEKKEFSIELNKKDFAELQAGFYTLNAEINVEDEKANVEGVIKFIEKDIVTTTRKDYGMIISTKIIEKKNEGNVAVKSETTLEKNIISRLFTSFSPEPDISDRKGFNIFYTWEREIKPGETLEIDVKTNWLLPFLIVIVIIVILVLARQYSKTNIVLKKRVSFVRAKGGEFALKISIIVQAREYVEKISITDRLPMLVKIHERFTGEMPSRIDEKNRRIEWNFEKLAAGEVRMLSYIVYSKIGVLGKFALPSATAIYERDGEIQETESNKTFFIAEARKRNDDE